MPDKKDFRDELVRLKAESDQRMMRMREIVGQIKEAIKSGAYSLDQAKADIAEIGLSKEGTAELLSLLD